jgi:lysophospholipase L1-like esterase
MRKILFTAIACVLFFSFAWGQPYHFKIAVIGSSTALGTGASPIDSSWANLTKFYLKELKDIDTIYNSAVGGTFTGQGAGAEPDTGIVWVMNTYNPDVVIASYASNDAAADVPVDSTMLHLRTIYNTVVSAGKICYITTPHPRDYFTHYQDSLQLDVRDSTFAEFGAFSLDFWHCIVDADSVSIVPQYNSGDGVHVNNAGHQQLFQVVKNANIMSPLIPLALATDGFSAAPEQQDIVLNWTTAATGSLGFVIQRSQDGSNFSSVGQEAADANLPGTHYNWKDVAPLVGPNYYRLETIANGNISWSPIVSLDWGGGQDWRIGGIYLPQGGTQLSVEVQSSRNRNITLGVFDVSGRRMCSQQGYVTAPLAHFTVPVVDLAQGQYFLRVISADGKTGTRAFLKW